jgi:Ca2+-transporting ATPase
LPAWHSEPLDDLLANLQVDPSTGLALAEVEQRRQQYGPNELVERDRKSVWRMLWDQLATTLIVLLLVAAVVAAVLGDTKEAVAILVIVVLNALLGLQQEYRAEKAIAALKRMAVPRVHARRDGRNVEISARELVPGDILTLEAGGAIPADGRLLEASSLRVLESTLTGESEPVEKRVEAHFESGQEIPLGDRHNMVFLGTNVTYGRATVVVCATGMATELGKIAGMIQGVRSGPTPLQRRLQRLGQTLALISLGIVAVIFGIGLAMQGDLKEMFLTAVSLAVAAVPEGLPAVVTIALALGAQRMLRRRALIRQLPAVETLGSVTTICSDKTGTLTLNQMTVTVLNVAGNRLDVSEPRPDETPPMPSSAGPDERIAGDSSLLLLLIGGALCNDAALETGARGGHRRRHRVVGDPTEAALVVAAALLGLDKSEIERTLPRVGEMPFDSDRKRMTTIHRLEAGNPLHDLLAASNPEAVDRAAARDGLLGFTKGAVDGLLRASPRVWVDGRPQPLDESWRQRILRAHDELAQEGVRVLGIALRPPGAEEPPLDSAQWETDLVFVGLVGMIDPPRPEAQQAVATCRQAGIRPIMITGDHPLTASNIAARLGIADSSCRAVSGTEVQGMSDEELRAVVREVSVFARVSPEHKLRLVRCLQQDGQVVAMTGDGVNDAPALKQADIGIAMGITGTDVAKEASDAVLQDDNFATIVAAVEEGRIIYDNIRKFIRYTMTSNTGEILVMLLAPLLGMRLPLLPLQILWINLVTDGLPGLALAVEPGERDTMQRGPHPPNEHVFARGMGWDILWIGAAMGFVSLATARVYWGMGGAAPDEEQLRYWRTIVFTVLTLSQMGNALAIRSSRDSLFKIGLLSNKFMLFSVALTFALQMGILYTPLRHVFDTAPLSLADLVICLAASTVVFWLVEAKKLWVRWRYGAI